MLFCKDDMVSPERESHLLGSGEQVPSANNTSPEGLEFTACSAWRSGKSGGPSAKHKAEKISVGMLCDDNYKIRLVVTGGLPQTKYDLASWSIQAAVTKMP